ncbi:carbohydrate-binding family 9-like protein [Rufibacter immobilis]|uniref:carbohydrate-binding family 9-like protein n=1 Tax=Rufibacter immobilis TaxID=1348778 RepID=UPI0035E50C3A
MKSLDIPSLSFLPGPPPPLDWLTQTMDALPRHLLSETPWPDGQAKPEVTFSVGHSTDCLYLKYYVEEEQVQARYRRTNEPVYKDSCVELFIAFNNESSYYNLEFNCLGTYLVGFGEDRQNRRLLPGSTAEKIKVWSTLSVRTNALWQLTIAIPAEVFCAHRLLSFEGVLAKGNFHKCGDELPNPHYLTWNPVAAPQPDFHRPECFGDFRFI